MKATLTIAGLYNYDPTIFDNLALPADVDKDTVIFHIIEECGFLEIMFPNPEYLKTSIEEWSKGMLLGWQRFWSAINKAYEPLYNYDMTEEITVDLDGTNTGTVTLDYDGTNTGDVTNSKTGYNSDTFQDTDKRTDDLADTIDSTTTNDLANTIDSTTTTERSGNIGVTSSQQLLEAELEVSKKLNFYKEVARDFKEKYCVLIY